MTRFGDRLIAAMRAKGPLCVGLDPYPDRTPIELGAPDRDSLERFGIAAVNAVAPYVGAIKPQIALFERYGPEGLAALAAVVRHARAAGLLVILDAKRGDIAATAAGYAAAYLGPDAWMEVDAVTVNPYMGADSLTPWLDAVRARGKGLAVLLRTSNPGSADLQGLHVGDEPVWARLAQTLRPLVDAQIGETGWSSVMMVVGATAPAEARRARELLPAAPFLAPGFGSQGAGAADAFAGARTRPDGVREGVLVNASRSVLYGEKNDPRPDTVEQWTQSLAERAAAQADQLTLAARSGAGSIR